MPACISKFCRTAPQPGRKVCDKCRKQKQRANNPMKTAYDNTKNSALARGIPWNLTLEEFESFAVRCKLLQGRGRSKEGWHVDRISETDPRGYHPANINKATNSENAQKETRRRRWDKLRGWLAEAGFPSLLRGPEVLEVELIMSVQYDYHTKEGFTSKRAVNPIPDEKCPF